MARKSLWAALVTVSVILAWTHVQAGAGSVVDVRIISDSGGELGQYRTYLRSPQGASHDGKYFYLEAVKGTKYSIQVTNRSDRRIAVVIAVDGRNIISGQKSDLKRNERMYVIGPYETDTFEGWRTGMDRTNRFYFTEPSDSYAEKVFADGSAMGTIALAVYRERVPEISSRSRMKEGPAGVAPSAPIEGRSASGMEKKKDEQAGTGFGETTYSPAQVVQFDPEPAPAEKVVLKYEWRSELCRKGIVRCGPRNRFWPDDQEFAPVPKDFRG
jgi:hypothetical protein